MRYLADTIVEHILAESRGAGTFRFVLPSYPAGLLRSVGDQLEERVARVMGRRVSLEYGIAYALGQEWAASGNAEERADLERMRGKGWYNEGNNLTSLRNRLRDGEGEDALVTVVAGYDHIPDRASLLDFFRLDDGSIWSICLRRSFGEWVRRAFEQVLDPDDHRTTIEEITGLLGTVYGQGLADLVGVSRYLEGLDLSGVYSGTDAYRLVLGDLSAFHLPPMLGLARAPGRRSGGGLSSYLNHAQEFANYGMFLEERGRKRALDAVAALRAQDGQGLEDLEPETWGECGSADEALDALERYVAERSEEDRKRLLTADFVCLHDRVLGHKTPKHGGEEPPPPPRTRTVRGLPPEVFLRALWMTLADYGAGAKDEQVTPEEDLRGIRLQSLQFRHDIEGGSEDGTGPDADREMAEEFLTKVLGGIDQLLEEQIALGEGPGREAVEVRSLLAPSEKNTRLSWRKSSRAEPRLEFEVVLTRAAGRDFRRTFYWALPHNHPSRVLANLLDWALEGYAEAGNALPAYGVPHMAEIFSARDEDEVCRLVGVALEGDDRQVVDLLGGHGLSPEDPLLPPLRAVSQSFQRFLVECHDGGFYSGMRQRFDDLRRSYLEACEVAIGRVRASDLLGPLLKAFLLVDGRSAAEGGWGWRPELDCAVASPLHPAVLDMIRHQHAFLCESFCVEANEGLREPGGRRFAIRLWDHVTDLAKIERPLIGTLPSASLLDSSVRSYGYLHLLGHCERPSTQVSSRLLLDYDEEDDDDVTDAELFRETRTATLIRNTLLDYRALHAHADDGISIGAYCGGEIQPVIVGIDGYLQRLVRDREQSGQEERLYGLRVTIFSTGRDDSSATRWLNAWRERWQQAELTTNKRHYANCRISIAYRVVSEGQTREQLTRLLRDTPLDVMFFGHFVEVGGSRFVDVDPEETAKDGYRLFPVLDMSCCAVEGGGRESRRERVISQRRFALAARHGEVMARVIRGNIGADVRHVAISESDFGPWGAVLDAAHESSAWVVCVDSAVDEQLLRRAGPDVRRTTSEDEREREIIGFGTGVGAHGESNYTVSTQQFDMADIERRIGAQIAERMGPWEAVTCERMARSLVREASGMSGLSVVKATGPSEYVRDYIGYAALRKLLRPDPTAFCDEMVSLDAFSHWFDDGKEEVRPDLLRLRARVIDGYLDIDAQIIECKLAQWSDGYLNKARDQVAAGLSRLVGCFRPRREGEVIGIHDRPDQRYWWMQLHRLLASRGAVTISAYREMLKALERVAEGYFTIRWQGAVVAFWTDVDRDRIECEAEWQLQIEGEELAVPAYTSGGELVRRICLENASQDLFAGRPVLERAFRREEVVAPVEPVGETPGDPVEERAVVEERVTEERGETLPHGEEVRDNGGSPREVVRAVTVRRGVAERVLLGHTIPGGREVHWEFGHPELPNRHILVFGASGTGKTYTIQAILCELSKAGQNALIVDYTNGFTTNQMERVTRDALHPKQHLVRVEPLPVNPFRQQCDYIDDFPLEESPANTAERVTGVFSEVYQLGDQQWSALYSAIQDGIIEDGEGLSLERLIERLEERREEGGPVANSVASVISKIQPFVDMRPFGRENPDSWEAMYSDDEARCHIIQLAGFSKDTARLITEFSLIDLYRYYRAQGNKDRPRVVVLDEIQNLDHKQNGPLGQLLTEGRKFGISLVLATQTLSSLDRDERDRLFQASHKLFFKPADTELRSFAQILEDATGERSEEWVRRLSSLARGECFSIGPAKSDGGGSLDMRRYTKIGIQSLEKRF